MKVCFLYNAQLHQIPHSLPVALDLARRHPDFDVEVAGASDRHLDFARRLAASYGPAASVTYRLLERPWDVRLRARLTGELAPQKKRTLFANASYLSGCDALVTPERTSLALRRAGLLNTRTRLIYTGHGAGDREITVAPDTCEFDFVFACGSKLEKRMLDLGLIRPGAYATGVYAKFDWVLSASSHRQPLFDNGRPTVLYSPHFEQSLSSWPDMGWKVLDNFARSTKYNLVFAPHVRMFEPPSRNKYRAFRRYAELPNMLIDLGSERCIDMSYTLGADAYLGDVSSQVAEFMLRPRPCLFLNPRGTDWQGDANYRFWTLGPVLRDVGELGAALEQAFNTHESYQAAQHSYFEETFGGAGRGEPSAQRGADLVADFLRKSAVAPVGPG